MWQVNLVLNYDSIVYFGNCYLHQSNTTAQQTKSLVHIFLFLSLFESGQVLESFQAIYLLRAVIACN